MQPPAIEVECADAQLGAGCAGGTGLARRQHRTPAIQVERGQRSVDQRARTLRHAHRLACGRRQRHRGTLHLHGVALPPAQELRRGQTAKRHRNPVPGATLARQQVHAQGQQFVGTLGERRRQTARDPAQAGLHRHLGTVPVHENHCAIRCRTRDEASQRMVEQRPKILRLHIATRIDHQVARAAHAARELDRTAEEDAADLRDAEPCFGKTDASGRALQGRELRIENDCVVRELEFAIQAAAREVLKRQFHAQLQASGAGGCETICSAIYQAAQWTHCDVAQELCARALRGACDAHDMAFSVQRGHRHSDVRKTRAKHPARSPFEGECIALELELSVHRFDTRPSRQRLHHTLAHPRSDKKGPCGRIGIGKITQPAFKSDTHIAAVACEHGGRDPLSRGLAHDRRTQQILRRMPRVRTLKTRREIDGARTLRGLHIGSGQAAGKMLVRKCDVRELHAQRARCGVLPFDPARETRERDTRLWKNRRKIDARLTG